MITVRSLAQLLISFEKHQDAEKAVERVYSFLESRNMLDLLPSVLKKVEMFSQRNDSGEVMQIESPYELEAESLSKIKSIVGAPENVSCSVKINKDLVGGYEVLYRSKKYTSSVRGSLDQLADQLRA